MNFQNASKHSTVAIILLEKMSKRFRQDSTLAAPVSLSLRDCFNLFYQGSLYTKPVSYAPRRSSCYE